MGGWVAGLARALLRTMVLSFSISEGALLEKARVTTLMSTKTGTCQIERVRGR